MIEISRVTEAVNVKEDVEMQIETLTKEEEGIRKNKKLITRRIVETESTTKKTEQITEKKQAITRK